MDTILSFFSTQYNTFIEFVQNRLNLENIFKLVLSIVLFIFCLVTYRIIKKAILKSHSEKLKAHQKAIIIKILKYLFYGFSILLILNLFGIKLSAIWGAAGIAGIAIGFAAQTSISNLISGIFVISEGAFKIGDSITVDDQTGIVDSINLLSIRIHTYDNQMIRIPNSKIIECNLKNNSYFTTRRINISISVDFLVDFDLVQTAIQCAFDNCNTLLTDPEPRSWIESFEERNVIFSVIAWCSSNEYIIARDQLFKKIKEQFVKFNIDLASKNVKIVRS